MKKQIILFWQYEEGKPVLLGSAVYSTDSDGKLAFPNNVISIFKVEVNEAGNFLSIETN